LGAAGGTACRGGRAIAARILRGRL
jgi:hypothetical protein